VWKKDNDDYLRNALLKGAKFELDSYFRLIQDNPDAKIFSGLCIPDYRTDSKTTTIDKVVFISNRCFVIEEKSYSTSITGTLDNFQWFGLTGERFTWFKNPIKQNLYHTTCLTMWLKKNGHRTKDYRFIQLVVVPDSCEICIPAELMTTVVNLSCWEERLRELEGKPINQDIIKFIGGHHV